MVQVPTEHSYTIQGTDLANVVAAIKAGGSTVFTLNMSHMRLLTQDKEFRDCYARASIITLDSNFLNRYFLKGRTKVATGSGLVDHLCRSGEMDGLSVLLIGNVSAADAARLLPGSRVETLQPSFGFIARPEEVADIAARCSALDPDVIFVAVGAPQSEKLTVRLRDAGVRRASIVCCGAAFEFMLGTQRRSPAYLQTLGLEWSWRMASDPRRLARRYLADAAFLVRHLPQYAALARTPKLVVEGISFDIRDLELDGAAPAPSPAVARREGGRPSAGPEARPH